MSTGLLISIIGATLLAGTPLVLAALGELVAERSGVLNLSVEGMMAVGALAAFATAHSGASPTVAVAAGAAAAGTMALAFGYLTLTLLANQVAAGLAFAIFGQGLTAFLGKPYEAMPLDSVPPMQIPLLSDLPFLGPALFNQSGMVYLSWILIAAVMWVLYRSKVGLIIRAIGESPHAATAVGYPVIPIRYAAVVFGGAMAGLGGAYLSIYYTPMWSQGMIAGRGWVALALVVFATWRPLRVIAGAYLFGGVLVTQLFSQSADLPINIPSQFFSMLPYLATIFVLVLISRNPKLILLNSPGSLGKVFRPDK